PEAVKSPSHCFEPGFLRLRIARGFHGFRRLVRIHVAGCYSVSGKQPCSRPLVSGPECEWESRCGSAALELQAAPAQCPVRGVAAAGNFRAPAEPSVSRRAHAAGPFTGRLRGLFEYLPDD